MRIIGLMGQKQHGKDTVAKHLHLNYGFQIVRDFAYPLKEALCCIFGWTMDSFETDEQKEAIDPYYGISRRQAMQDLGTNWGREGIASRLPEFARVSGSNLWLKRYVQYFEPFYREEQRTGQEVLVATPGIRFQNEMDIVRAIGGEVWSVFNPRKVSTDAHKSETGVADLVPDWTISNSGSISDLHLIVDELMSERFQRIPRIPHDTLLGII